ncbi:MAG TPA: biopolymer transporter ExbD [Bacteroidia bacterium]|jgi:biopolymer transport protein ExbD|nr:biopolymer transporter ExbD [Bacteroidia bacterium]HLP33515.1 biopolymer transporter ExbD [Bacteroidia bacterium]
MAKVKPHRKKPTLDMTPVVDLAFLLVTFFMLSAKFKAPEPVIVDTPSSTSDLVVKEENLVTLLVSNDGKVFFNVDNQDTRYNLISKLSEAKGLNLTPEEMTTFSISSSFGMPFSKMKSFLALPSDERQKITQEGIPCDSLNNELKDWLVVTRTGLGIGFRYAIKGDAKSDYKIVDQVITTLQTEGVKVNKFNLITTLEKE